MAHLAGLDQLLHRAHRLLDRRFRIDTMKIVEIDVVDPEPPQRPLARRLHILRPAIDRLPADPRHRSRIACDAELGRRSEEHTSELQSLMRTSYAVFCLKKQNHQQKHMSY